MFSWLGKALNTASAWTSAIVGNLAGVNNVVQWFRRFVGTQPGSAADLAVAGVAAGLSILPAAIQGNSYNKMMAKWSGDDVSCSCGAKSCCCDNSVSQIYSASTRTLHSFASLSLVSTRLLGVPGGFAFSTWCSVMNVFSQYYVIKSQSLQQNDLEESWLNNFKKFMSAGGCMAGVSTAAMGITTIATWIKEGSLTAVVDHTSGSVQLADVFSLCGALLPMVLQGMAYYSNADQVLSKQCTQEVEDSSETKQQIEKIQKILNFVVIYSALYKSLGSVTGVMNLATLVDNFLLLGPGPAIGMGVLCFVLMVDQQYPYINRPNLSRLINAAVTSSAAFWQRLKDSVSIEPEAEQRSLLTQHSL